MHARDWVIISGGLLASAGLAYAALTDPPLTALTVAAVTVASLVIFGPARSVLGTSASLGLLLVVVAFAVPTSGGSSLYVAYAIAAGLVLIGVLRAGRRLRWTPLSAVFVVYLAYCTVVTFVAGGEWFYSAVALVGIPTVVALQSATNRERRMFSGALILAATASAAIAIRETATGTLLLDRSRLGLSGHAFIPGGLRAEATLGQPLILGLLMAVATVVVLRSRIHWVAKLAFTAIFLGGIYASGSASMMVLVLFGIGLHVASRIPAVPRTIVTILGAVGVLVYFTAGAVPAWLSDLLSPANAAQRTNSLDSVGRILGDQPLASVLFGNGWNSAHELYANGIIGQSVSNAVDNQLVTSLVDTGVLGVGLVVAILAMSVVRGGFRGLSLSLPVIASFFVFDTLLWVLPVILCCFAWTQPGGKDPQVSVQGDPISGSGRAERPIRALR